MSRARAVSHQRAAARRAAARAAAQRRKESLELELAWALQAEAEEKAAVAAAVDELRQSLSARDRADAQLAETEEQRQLDEMTARWRQRDAAVMAVLAADAAEARLGLARLISLTSPTVCRSRSHQLVRPPLEFSN